MLRVLQVSTIHLLSPNRGSVWQNSPPRGRERSLFRSLFRAWFAVARCSWMRSRSSECFAAGSPTGNSRVLAAASSSPVRYPCTGLEQRVWTRQRSFRSEPCHCPPQSRRQVKCDPFHRARLGNACCSPRMADAPPPSGRPSVRPIGGVRTPPQRRYGRAVPCATLCEWRRRRCRFYRLPARQRFSAMM
jgi:hypothetical protein